MQTLFSQPIVNVIKQLAKDKSAQLIDGGIDPQLAVILVGNNEDSLRYIAMKTRVAKEVGVILSLYHIEAETPFKDVEETIRFLNKDPDIHGVIIQLPLPEHFTQEQTDTLLKLVDPGKDVDGLGGAWKEGKAEASSFKQLLEPQSVLLPPMVSSILSLLDHYNIPVADKRIVIVGKGRLVGQPLEAYFQSLGCEVASVDEETADILAICQTADILITGTGEPDLITYQWLKPDAVVLDCANDVHEDSVTQVASALAPARGGVGPLTVTWLLYNTIQAAITLSGASHV